jgi:phage terminase large subunit-like protein
MAVQVDHRLFDKQWEFFSDEAPFSAAVCGIGGGKTLVGALKTLSYMQQYPGSLGMVTAPTYPMLRDATLRTIEEVFPKGAYTLNIGDMTIHYHNGSEILLRPTSDPDRLRGPNLAFVWMDEAAQSDEAAFLVLQGRLRQPTFPHKLWITTTPKGFNWVYREFAQEQRPDYAMHRWATKDNPHLPESFVRQLEESYDASFGLQELLGEFVLVGGNPFFDGETLRSMLDDCRDPLRERLGAVKIWKNPSPAGRYVAGGDLAWGQTGAYSCLVIADYQTGEEVAEIHGRLPAEEMAKMSVDLCREYNNAFAVIEANNEGVNVVNRMMELGYGGRMFHRDPEGADRVPEIVRMRLGRVPKRPGWTTTGVTRPVMLGDLHAAVRNREIVIHDRDAVSEMLTFVRDDKGKPGPAEGQYSDRVIAWALAVQGRKWATFTSTPIGQKREPVVVRRW